MLNKNIVFFLNPLILVIIHNNFSIRYVHLLFGSANLMGWARGTTSTSRVYLVLIIIY